MIDPVIFSIKLLGGLTLTLHWYGVLVVSGMLVGGWVAEKEINRRGGNGNHVWDAMLWVIPAGILGARVWYVINALLGGNRTFIEDPISIVKFWDGGIQGLHFFGGLLFGAIALFYYMRKHNLDTWLLLDSVAPVTLIGQAVARPANYINQELYGPPTTLPWGIPIDAYHRLSIYADLGQYPVATTRFHPTFAYEMIWNFLAAALLIWLARRYAERIKPGTIFGGWLILAGAGRVLIELFRPDQPKIPGTQISYSSLVSFLMVIGGVIFLLARFGKIKLGSFQWPDAYQLSPEAVPSAQTASKATSSKMATPAKKRVVRRVRRTTRSKAPKPKE